MVQREELDHACWEFNEILLAPSEVVDGGVGSEHGERVVAGLDCLHCYVVLSLSC